MQLDVLDDHRDNQPSGYVMNPSMVYQHRSHGPPLSSSSQHRLHKVWGQDDNRCAMQPDIYPKKKRFSIT
jgi:hypothetical protein